MSFPKQFKPKLKKVKTMEKRTKEQLQHEYATALAQLGEIQYKVLRSKEDVKKLMELVDKLQQEAVQLAKEEAADKVKSEVKEEVPPSV